MSTTFIVTGLPKCTCRYTDVYRLFSTVAQVKKLTLNSEKGSASVSLWDKSSLDFILSQRWTLNGSVLTLTRYSNFHGNTHGKQIVYSNSIIHDQANTHSYNKGQEIPTGFTYSQYKETTSSFWKDVSHCSRLVPSRQGKRKKTGAILLNHTQLTVQTCENRKKKKKKRLKRKKRHSVSKENTAVQAIKKNAHVKVLESKSVSGANQSSVKHTKSCFEQLSSQICSVVPETKESNKLVSSAICSNVIIAKSSDEQFSSAMCSDVNTKSCNKQFSSANMLELKSDNQSNSSIKTSNYQISHLNNEFQRNTILPENVKLLRVGKTPLYVHFNSSKFLVYVNTQSSLEDVQMCILEKSGIPINLQMITYQGKIFTKDRDFTIEPYDFVQVLVRARGGMKNEQENTEEVPSEEIHEATGGESQNDGNQTFTASSSSVKINKKSSSKDIQEWLSAFVSKEILEKYDDLLFLKGKTFFKYSDQDYHKLAEDVGIPIGLSRKMLFFRDRKLNILLSDMTTWTSEKLGDFIEKLFLDFPKQKVEMIQNLTSVIKEKMIDGLVFISYSSSDDMASDFKDLQNIKQIVFETIIDERDEYLGKNIQEPKDDGDLKDEIANQERNEKERVLTNPQEKEIQNSTSEQSDKLSQYCAFLEKKLQLQKQNVCSEEILCTLRILHTSWSKVNDLEKKFVFFILCKDSEYLDKIEQKTLWKQIRKSTNQWINKFSKIDTDLCSFEATNKDEEYKKGSKKYCFSESPVTWRYVMEKEIDDINRFSHCILLISKQLFQRGKVYKAELSAAKSKKKQMPFAFTFKEDIGYILFDPEDYAFGFQDPDSDKKTHVESTESSEMKEVVPTAKCTLNVASIEQTLNVKSIAQTVLNVAITGNTNEDSLEDQNNKGARPKVSIKIENRDPESQNKEMQHPRPFKGDSSYYVYHKGHLLNKPESSGTMLNRSTEYKLFAESVKMERHVEKFLIETLRFAAGCLNTRHNGTIYFGVGDNIVESIYKHGEIVGIPDENNKMKVALTDSLREAIRTCFPESVNNIADKCIGDPLFIRVNDSLSLTRNLYIVEVDVYPVSDLCEQLSFELNLTKCKNISNYKGIKDGALCVRKGSNTCQLDTNAKQMFIQVDLKQYIKSRLLEEKSNCQTPFSPIEKPLNKFCRLLCRGKEKLDKATYPILVLGKPTEEQKASATWMDTISFIKRFPFVSSVFDFDDWSNCNGLSKLFRKEDHSTLTSGEIFHDHVGDTQLLMSKFNPDKTVWILANGRGDVDPPKPHLRSAEWQYTHLGVCDAVIFFSQHSVIPKSRALVIIMLFSNDFDGVIDTFLEIYKRFKTDQILILAEEVSVFKIFEENIVSRGGPGISYLGDMSIVGVKWKDIKTTVLDLVGYEDESNFFVPSSTTGNLRRLTERFRERLTDLELLNSKQCEGRKNVSVEERVRFKKEKEMEFYMGNNVSWWNFFYNDHVLERHCFKEIYCKMENLLKRPTKQKFNVVSFSLECEPGAGGSTLCRHILWSFRTEYKCAVVKKLAINTAHQVVMLWKACIDKEEIAKPILLLLDDISQSECTYEDFIRQLNAVFRNETNSKDMKCLVFICHRVEENQTTDSQVLPSMTHYLLQKVTEEEKRWLEEKHAELDKEGGLDFKPEHLLSFMVLRTDFNKRKIQGIVKNLMTQLTVKSFEFELMQFIAMITEKTPPSRRSTKVAIPLECCDDFYWFSDYAVQTESWERILSKTLNILLVFENKETAGGIQIRMAHPMLAKSVLDYTLSTTKKLLSTLAAEMLKSPLVKSKSRGRDDIIEIIHVMLNRRTVYEDEKQTQFSPLIESIIEDEKTDNEKGYANASNVLKEAFSLLRDDIKFGKYAGTTAQTLARLYAKQKAFDKAIDWAKQSLEMALKENRCFFLHTYGNVLKEQFQHRRDKMLNKVQNEERKIDYEDVLPLLKIILLALEQFLNAQNESVENSKTAVSYKDAVVVINMITNFLQNNVRFPQQFELKRYLLETESNSQDGICENWDPEIHSKLKKLKEHGEKSFIVFERQVCFYTVQDQGYQEINLTKGDQIRKDHSFLLAEFITMFGENGDDPPKSLCTYEMRHAKDDWHRRRLLKLHGNSYMNIFGLYGKYKKSWDGYNRSSTTKKFEMIRKHVSLIGEKVASDLASSLCINIALGLMGAERDTLKSIIETCRNLLTKSQIDVKVNCTFYDLACYFIIVLMWPCTENQVEYDDELFSKCLRHLRSISTETKTFHKNNRGSVRSREEYRRYKPTTQFFLSNCNASKFYFISHRYDVLFNEDDEFVWDKPFTRRILKRLRGQVLTKSNRGNPSYQCIVIPNEKKQGSFIEIRQIRGRNSELLSEEPVTFYLGFSMSGPIAYNIISERDIEVLQ